ncbi:MAG: AraC family transcriptional regulator [Pseudomonadales bacterium]|jgi:AraC-like DNA-binding protein
MGDRLVEILKYFELHARVFQAGPLCRSSQFDAAHGLGYIHLLQQGKLDATSPAHQALHLSEPSLLLYMTPTEHTLVPRDRDVEMVCASFEFGAGLNNPFVMALPDVVCIKLAEIPSLEPLLTLMFRESADNHCGRQAVLDRLMEVVFIQLLRHLMDENRMEFGLIAGLSDQRLCKAINAIHSQPAENLSLEKLAACAGMSRSRFATHFRDTVGLSPGAYLTLWRLSIAQSLLSKGKSLQLIADTIGYGSASALSRVFKAQTGQTPREWLSKHRSST